MAQSPINTPMPSAANPRSGDLNPGIPPLPTSLYSDEPPLESYLHLQQILILLSSLDWLWQERNDYFAAGNLTIYYNPDTIPTS